MSRTVEPVNTAVPVMPERLVGPAATKWGELLILLAARNVRLIPEDADRLAEYCDAYALRCRAVKELDDSPLILSTPNGAQMTNPLLKVIRQAEQTMHKISTMYGLDLKSRLGKPDMAPKPKSSLAAFLEAG